MAPNLDRERDRQKYKARVANALEEDDPLAAYHQFVHWIIKNYGENDPSSGLGALLDEATTQFQNDSLYKTDLRYLKLWALRARQMDRTGALSIYAFLIENDIGTSYSALYEDYANILEAGGSWVNADHIYRKGIERTARPLARLKTRYAEFQTRKPSSSGGTRPEVATSSNGTQRQGMMTAQAKAPPLMPGATFNSTAAQRYALMLAPPAPGKRPEKFRFNLSLLFTDEGVEYSIQEARARSMGLLGKKWGPPPPSETSRASIASSSSSLSSSYLTPVNFNDDGQKTSRSKGAKRRSMAEPTVTINTKEALADVFGMFNSPEKTFKMAPGSKHAPIKKVEPVTPVVPPKINNLARSENENPDRSNIKTPLPAFRPFRDENAQSERTPANSKFTPFMDPEQQQRTPFVTPRPVLSAKDPSQPMTNPRLAENTPRIPSKLGSDNRPAEPVFSKVFTPASKSIPLAPLRDVFTDDHGKPTPKAKPLTHERAKSHHDVMSGRSEDIVKPHSFTPFTDDDARTPFKVFSRPAEQERVLGVFTPKTPAATFTPFVDPKPAFTPFKDTALAFKPSPDIASPDEPTEIFEEPPVESLVQDEDEFVEEPEPTEEYDLQAESTYEPEADPQEQSYEEEDSQVDYQGPSEAEHLVDVEDYEEGESFHQEAPLGGRFGQFNVMTPITERTFEFTSSTRGTPFDRYGNTGRSDIQAAEEAQRLAAELREDDDGYEEEEEDAVEQGIEPIRFSVPPSSDPDVVIIEEKAGSLSLLDTLTLGSKFRPNNPCNPFASSILSTLLSRIPTDPHFHDLRNEQSGKLEELQRFAKKSRKTSSSSNSGAMDGNTFPLTLQGHRFTVSEKLGEGGFGTVFKARDLGKQLNNVYDDDDDFEEDEDEEGSSMVALKVVKPRNVWEYHVLRRLHSALPTSLRRSVVLPHALYAYGDESYLVLDLCPQGMLLNTINNAVSAGVAQAGACLDELLVMFFTIELLRLVASMHSVGFIHGDLKIDNCLLRLEDVPGGAAAWSSTYQPSGEGGWSYKGLKIIDFGRTIDMRLFPSGQTFIADWATDDRDCFEVRENKPWTYQTDYFGLAGIVYCMLFGKYIQAGMVVTTVEGGVRRHKIATPLKRYWQAELWTRLFDVLLNPCLVRPGGELPVCDALNEVRAEMEEWLQANCNRTSGTLKGLLKKVELSCY